MSGARRAPRVAAAWLPVIAYTLLIWWISSRVVDFRLIERFPFQDKGVHLLEYLLLGLLMSYAVQVTWPTQRLRYFATLWLTCGLGLVDELHQLFVPGRSADAADLVADSLGALLATLGSALWSLRARRR
jgi:VanZ family protein